MSEIKRRRVALRPIKTRHDRRAISKGVGGLTKLHGRRQVPVLSKKTRDTFMAISSPKNAELFSVEAALKAFAHI